MARFQLDDWMNFLIIAIVALGAIAKKLIEVFSSKSLRQSPLERMAEEAQAREAQDSAPSARPVARPLSPAVLRRDVEAGRPVATPMPPVAEPRTNLPEIIFEMLGVPMPQAPKRPPAGPRKMHPRPVPPSRTPVGPAVQPRHVAQRPAEAAPPRHRPRAAVAAPAEPMPPDRDTRAGLLDKEALIDPAESIVRAVDPRELLSHRSLRHAVILSEILGLPLSLRPYEDRVR